MIIIDGQYPPNIDIIDAKFLVKGKKGIIYAYGDAIYNPDSIKIPNHIYVHETIHGVRQTGHVDKWWADYIADPEFRLNEELYSHRAEWATFCEENQDRNERARYFHFMTQRLAGPLYNNMLTVKEARSRILGLGA